MTSAAVQVNGKPVHITGNGERTIVMLHGWPDTAALWQPQVEHFSGDYTCVTFTMPGFERGDRRDHSVADVVAHIGAVIDIYLVGDTPLEMTVGEACPRCDGPSARPDIVWFGEIPYHMERIERALEGADIFVAVGTSGNVYPAAGFVQMARHVGARTIEMNLDPGENVGLFDEIRPGKASDTVPQWVDEVLGG